MSFGLLKLINEFQSRGFRATSLSTYDFSTLYTTSIVHNSLLVMKDSIKLSLLFSFLRCALCFPRI